MTVPRIPFGKLTELNVVLPKDVLLLMIVYGEDPVEPGTLIIKSALLIPVTLPVAVMRPAVEALAIVTPRSGEFPDWKSTPPEAPDIVKVYDERSRVPLVTTTRWLEPVNVTFEASVAAPEFLLIVQLPVGAVPPV